MIPTPPVVRQSPGRCAVGEAFRRFGAVAAGTEEVFFIYAEGEYFKNPTRAVFRTPGDELDGDPKSDLMIRIK